MFSENYYHGIGRKYMVAFGNLFSDIMVQRKNKAGVTVQTIQVPIQYGPKQKYMARIKGDVDFDEKVATSLPRMSFEFTGATYDSSRKLSSTIKNTYQSATDPDVRLTQFAPVPYNFDYTLTIYVKNEDDGMQIIEQILPYFRPEWTVNVRSMPDLNIVDDVPIVLTSFNKNDSYEGDFENRRALIYDLNFTIRGKLYGPTSTAGVIKRAITNIYDGVESNSTKIEVMTVTPSQYANGAPLYSPSANASLTVPIADISSNSDFGFSIDIDIDL